MGPMNSPALAGKDGSVSVTPDEIKRQRAEGWPDFHPEDYCHICAAPNPLWVTDRESWLTATADWSKETGREGICCPRCFIAMHTKATGEETIWTLVPGPVRDNDALSYVQRLLAILDKHGGYSTPSQQATMRGARQLLKERGVGAQGNNKRGESK